MKQIKTLTVNGESYRITDPEAARVEQLCPPLTESGAAVCCTPVKDYPLQVVSHLPAETQTLTLRHCGKNIFDIATAGVYHNNTANRHDHRMTLTDTGFEVVPNVVVSNDWTLWGFCLGTAKELAGKTITMSGRLETSTPQTQLPRASLFCTAAMPTAVRDDPQYSDGGYIGDISKRESLADSGKHTGYATVTYTVTGDEPFPYIGMLFYISYGGVCSPDQWTKWSDIQVEIGDAATDYEPYRGQTYTAQPGGADSYGWAEIPGLPGVNTLLCDAGTVTVTGRADPVAELERLKNAILALGGNL